MAAPPQLSSQNKRLRHRQTPTLCQKHVAHHTEPGFAGDIGTIEVRLIDYGAKSTEAKCNPQNGIGRMQKKRK